MATKKEKTAASRLKAIADYNLATLKKQQKQLRDLYTASDTQNRELRDQEIDQYYRKADADRYNAQRNMLNAARGVANTLGTGLQGSGSAIVGDLARTQQDTDNVDYWNTLNQNVDAADNAYQEAINANYMQRRQSAIDAQAQARDIEAQLAANLNNVNQSLYKKPDALTSKSTANIMKTGKTAAQDQLKKVNNRDRISGYTTAGY